MKRQDINFFEFVLMIALLMSLVSLSINMLLPAFNDISTDFNLQQKSRVQMSISLLYLGLGSSQLLYGPLSDHIGRKSSIILGILIFILGCFTSFLAQTMPVLIFGQVLQGIGLGAPRALSIAIVRDRYSDKHMARAISFIMIIYILTPIVAPALGKLIILQYGWRTIYIFFIVFALIIFIYYRFRMPETLSPVNKKEFTLIHITKTSKEVLKNKISLGYIAILGIYSGMFITYLNLSQSIFEVQYGLGNQYPIYFALLASSIGIASFLNGRIVIKTDISTIVKKVIIVKTLISALFLIIFSLGLQSFVWFVTFMFIQLMGYGFLIGNLNTLAMHPLGHIAGLGASIIGAVSTIISVPISIFVGQFYNNTSLPLIWGYFSVGCLSIFIYKLINNKFLAWKTV